MKNRRFIKLEDALDITSHDTVRALTRWIERWNLDHPDNLILRYYGKVERDSLERAFKQHVLDKTPGARRLATANKFLNQKSAGHARRS